MGYQRCILKSIPEPPIDINLTLFPSGNCAMFSVFCDNELPFCRTSKRIYPDSIVKELSAFREKFKDFCTEEGIELPIVTINDIEPLYEIS